MHRIGALLSGKRVALPIQVIDHSIPGTVARPADGGTKVRRVVFAIVFLGGEALDDVDACDAEFLDNGAQRDECER